LNYQTLVDEHDAIELASDALIMIARSDAPRPAAASDLLEHLARLVRDHLAHEDPVVYETIEAVKGGRHDLSATTSLAALDELRYGWTQYLYRWERDSVAARWEQFGDQREDMLGKVHARVAAETAVLYSLAVHHGILRG
jgi:hypothetical protein